ncbi:hypothetical protein NGM10_00390 [Halorussus salilacus]|uniref:DUF7545 family protein n=1 Tax=Halorussus salilacus TaxID=2953750 RepID=UPI00209F159D|nr:hypothetical protein [Halorussus salilacus]USZ68217.1 hypothetical protein NGM10_00390 [Halorussus salilacus]
MTDADDVETKTYTIESPDGDAEELTVPVGIVEMLREDETETDTSVLGDLAMLSLAQQAHALVHHGHGEPDPRVEADEQKTMELFEERFGTTFGEMTGHSH